MKNNLTKYVTVIIGLATIGSFALAMTASAAMMSGVNGRVGRGMMGQGQRPAVVGKVLTNDGTTITVSSMAKGGENENASENANENQTPAPTPSAATFTVTTTSSTQVTKNGTTSPVSGIAVGDTIIVQGTINGTNVVAKTIRDGVAQPVIQGNGQPIVAGSITSISGNTIVITNKSNVSYTVDATTTKITVGGQASTISGLATGDSVVVQGTVNGNSVTASSVIDQKVKTNGNGNGNSGNGFMGGMMDGIGNFFRHMFGF